MCHISPGVEAKILREEMCAGLNEKIDGEHIILH